MGATNRRSFVSVLVDVVLVVDSSVAGAVVDALVDVLIGGTLVSSGESFSPFMDRERLNSADTSSISFVFSASVIALGFAAEELLLTTALSEESAAITGRGSPLDAVIFSCAAQEAPQVVRSLDC